MAVTRARREAGVVYTPRAVCEPIVRRVLEPLLRGRTANEILALRVCDPAIGEGAFLIEVVRVLAEALPAVPSALRRVAERCVFGADIDARAVDAARASLERVAGGPLPALREHLRVGDALELPWQDDFDAVVGNPPYVRQERIAAHKRALRRYAAYDGAADLYVYFVELAHRVLRQGGRYGLIVPDKWMTADYGRALRTLLARERSVEGIVDFARAPRLFDDADAFPCIVWGERGSRAESIAATRVTDDTGAAEALHEPATPHPRARWNAEPWHIDSARDAALIDRLAARWPALGGTLPARPSRGIVTGCNRAFVIDGNTRDRMVAAEPAAEALIRPLVRGRDVRRWRARDGGRYVLLVDHGTSLARLPGVRRHLARFRRELEPRPRDHVGAWPGRKSGRYRWYELQDPVVPLAKAVTPRLLYQDIQTAPACCFDASGEVVADTTVWIVPSGDLFLLAVLNSSLYRWYAQRRFPPALGGAVRPKLAYVMAMPLARPEPELRARVEALVAEQLAAPVPERDHEIDACVLAAYGLGGDERALIEADGR